MIAGIKPSTVMVDLVCNFYRGRILDEALTPNEAIALVVFRLLLVLLDDLLIRLVGIADLLRPQLLREIIQEVNGLLAYLLICEIGSEHVRQRVHASLGLAPLRQVGHKLRRNGNDVLRFLVKNIFYIVGS